MVNTAAAPPPPLFFASLLHVFVSTSKQAMSQSTTACSHHAAANHDIHAFVNSACHLFEQGCTCLVLIDQATIVSLSEHQSVLVRSRLPDAFANTDRHTFETRITLIAVLMAF